MDVSEHQPNINDVLHSDTQSSLPGSRTLRSSCTGDDRVVCGKNKVYVCGHNSATPQDTYKTSVSGKVDSSGFLTGQPLCGICCDLTQPEIQCCDLADCAPSLNPLETVSCQLNQCVVSCEITQPEIEQDQCCDVEDCGPNDNH
jgi:hypothetical protein